VSKGGLSFPDHKARIRQALDVMWNGNDCSRDAEYYADDIVVHTQHEPEPMRGREALRDLHRLLHVAFPDYHATVEDMIQSGDEVAARWTVRGAHRGDYFGIPPTGRRVEVEEVVIFRFEGALVKEMWLMPNVLGSMQQLGIPSGPAPAPVRALFAAAERLRRLFGGTAGR
jgi:steroid delta-isomerase-like uncharacterized protein